MMCPNCKRYTPGHHCNCRLRRPGEKPLDKAFRLLDKMQEKLKEFSADPKEFTVTVEQIVSDEELDLDDLDEMPAGTYSYHAMTEEEALDEFHLDIPIACLEHFEITVEEKKHEN